MYVALLRCSGNFKSAHADMKKAHSRYLEGVKSGHIVPVTHKPAKVITAGPKNGDLAGEPAETTVEGLDSAVEESLQCMETSATAAEASLVTSREALAAVQLLQHQLSAVKNSKEQSEAVAVAVKAAESAVQAAVTTSAAVRKSAVAARDVAAALDAFLNVGDADAGTVPAMTVTHATTSGGPSRGKVALDDDAAVGCVPSIGGTAGARGKSSAVGTSAVTVTGHENSKKGKGKGKPQPHHVAAGGELSTHAKEKEGGKAPTMKLQPQEVHTLNCAGCV